jgi:hypothetical protein
VATNGLDEAQVARLMKLVAGALRQNALEAPHPSEREPAYTARCLRAPIMHVLAELQIDGLMYAGDGGAPVRPVPLFGLSFYPDLTVTFFGARTLAFEVKFLSSARRQNSVATGLGQAYLYRQAGYRRTGAFLIDLANMMSDEDIKRAEDVCRSADIDVIVRRKLGDSLAGHPR